MDGRSLKDMGKLFGFGPFGHGPFEHGPFGEHGFDKKWMMQKHGLMNGTYSQSLETQ